MCLIFHSWRYFGWHGEVYEKNPNEFLEATYWRGIKRVCRNCGKTQVLHATMDQEGGLSNEYWGKEAEKN
jgi:hypothetical protein